MEGGREKEVRRMGQKQKRIRQNSEQQDYAEEPEEIYKRGIKLAALRFQTGGRHQNP